MLWVFVWAGTKLTHCEPHSKLIKWETNRTAPGIAATNRKPGYVGNVSQTAYRCNIFSYLAVFLICYKWHALAFSRVFNGKDLHEWVTFPLTNGYFPEDPAFVIEYT